MASKLELTLEERLDQIFKEYTQKLEVAFYPVHSIYKQEAITKILSLLEPVELEILGDDELESPMTDKEPTQEQIKEFAKWCGFTDIRVFTGRLGWDGTNPDGEFKAVEIDLNNLFQYAVPKLEFYILSYRMNQKDVSCGVLYKGIYNYAYDKDPALALFWAIHSLQSEEARLAQDTPDYDNL